MSWLNTVSRSGVRVRPWRMSAPYDVQWFPGHMHKGVKQIVKILQKVDYVVEVHDARIPVSGRNPRFVSLLMRRPGILVLNKADLSTPEANRMAIQHYKMMNQAAMCVSLSANTGKQVVKDLVPGALQHIFRLWPEKLKKAREDNAKIRLMIVGVPNCGKSTLINRLRQAHMGLHVRGAPAPTGRAPAITRGVADGIKVMGGPNMPDTRLVDTPGITVPFMRNIEDGMKLGLCNAVNQHVIGHEVLVDYLLYQLKKRAMMRNIREWYRFYDDDINTSRFLEQAARRNGQLHKGGTENVQAAAEDIITKFNSGKWGQICLNDESDFAYLKRMDVDDPYAAIAGDDALFRSGALDYEGVSTDYIVDVDVKGLSSSDGYINARAITADDNDADAIA